ncbi:MAG: hypothetical protein HKN87_11195 [Saprospiraceae bacterium]|nr:hypothetical protein [Saprospiraceae bacterium]
MMRWNRVKLLWSCLVFAQQIYAQAEFGLLGNRHLLQSDLYNPASFHVEGLHIGLPSAMYNLHHTGPGYRDLVESTEATLLLKIRNVYDDLKGVNELVANFRLQTFKIKYGKGDWTFGVEHELISENSLQYPDALVQLYIDGNQPWIGETVAIGPDLRIESYHSLGLLVGRRLGRLNLALRPRLLIGQYFGYSERSKAHLHTDDSYYQLNFNSDFLYHDVGVVDLAGGNPLDFQIGRLDRWRLGDGHIGSAVDGGLEWQVNDRVNLGASFTDLGSILWNEDLQTYQSLGDHPYDGIEITNLVTAQEVDFVGAVDTLRSLLDFELVDGPSRFSLVPRYFFFFNYQPSSTLSLAMQIQYNSRYVDPFAIGLTATVHVAKRLHLGMIAGHKYGSINLGLQGALVLPKLIGFLALDNLLQGINPVVSQRFGVRAGINVHFIGTSLLH